MFRSGMRKIPKGGGKKFFSLSFLDPSSPRLASGSPGPPNYFRVKETTRLGEPVTSRVTISSPGRAAIAPSAHFPINRHAKEAERGFQHSVVEEIERIRREEEEMKLGRYQIVIVINPYFVSCSVFFVRPSVSFIF